MKAFAILAAGAALLTLGACGKGEDKTAGGEGAAAPAATNQSAEEVATELKKLSIEPGEWETTQEIIDVSMEGAPKEMPAGIIDAMKGRKTVNKICITPEQAKKPDADFMSGQKDSNCTYSGFNMSSGTVQGTITCPAEGGGTMKASLQGIYAANSYTTTMEMNAAGMGAGNGMTMHMKMKTTGKRLGDCPEK